MKTYEVPLKITPEGKVEFPEDFLSSLPREQEIRVIVLVPEPGDLKEHGSWARLTAEQFFAGYNEADSIYDRF